MCIRENGLFSFTFVVPFQNRWLCCPAVFIIHKVNLHINFTPWVWCLPCFPAMFTEDDEWVYWFFFLLFLAFLVTPVLHVQSNWRWRAPRFDRQQTLRTMIWICWKPDWLVNKKRKPFEQFVSLTVAQATKQTKVHHEEHFVGFAGDYCCFICRGRVQKRLKASER